MYSVLQIFVICVLMYAFGYTTCWILHKPFRDVMAKVQAEVDWITKARTWYEKRIAESGEELDDA